LTAANKMHHDIAVLGMRVLHQPTLDCLIRPFFPMQLSLTKDSSCPVLTAWINKPK